VINATSINRVVRRRRCHLAAVMAMLALGGAVVAHHLPAEHLGIGGAMVLCLAVLPAIAVAVAVARIVGGLLPRLRAVLVVPWPPSRLLANPPLPRARASPVATVVLRL